MRKVKHIEPVQSQKNSQPLSVLSCSSLRVDSHQVSRSSLQIADHPFKLGTGWVFYIGEMILQVRPLLTKQQSTFEPGTGLAAPKTLSQKIIGFHKNDCWRSKQTRRSACTAWTTYKGVSDLTHQRTTPKE